MFRRKRGEAEKRTPGGVRFLLFQHCAVVEDHGAVEEENVICAAQIHQRSHKIAHNVADIHHGNRFIAGEQKGRDAGAEGIPEITSSRSVSQFGFSMVRSAAAPERNTS